MEKLINIGLIIGIALFLRCCISFHPYSGEKTPPMFGDYEAQRHWQEITFNLPIETWYLNTSDNNLEYWGLDYPPLTAYHSLLIGNVANKIDAEYIKLFESRGFESQKHKSFMRLTVIISDLIVYIIPMIIFYLNISNEMATNKNTKDSENNSFLSLNNFQRLSISGLIYPGIILIDHGHFQYNCVSLGFFLLAYTAINRGYFSIASLFFVLALNYKQMELYHAIPFFVYILAHCLLNCRRKSLFIGLKMFARVSLTVSITFIVIWAPFYIKKPTIVFDIVNRLFPIKRGIFEDKVANIWCLINIFIKLRHHFSNLQLAKLCLLTTTISILPSSIDLLLNPLKKKFFLSLINISMNFYLFSFQVHEKSILLVAMPIILYYHHDPFISFWFLIVSTFSMLPLLIKDGLFIAYFGLMILYFVSMRLMWRNYFFSLSIVNNKFQFAIKICFYTSIVGIVLLSIASICLKPPKHYPDLFPLFVSIYSCIHFILFAIYFHVQQIFFTTNSTANKFKLH